MSPHRTPSLTQDDADWLRMGCVCEELGPRDCRWCGLADKIEVYLALELGREVSERYHNALRELADGPQEEG